MSLALDNNQVSGNGFFRREKIPPCNFPMIDRRDPASVRVVVTAEREDVSPEPSSSSSSSSSSIGKNSDDDNDDGEENEEVESKLNNNTLFDSAVDALEQALPIRRGISKFYNGKSKSFASLSDAACSSIKEIVKPENPYSRKRKNLLAFTLLNDRKGQAVPLPKYPGIPKRSIPSSRSTLTLGVSNNHHDSSIDENGSSPETSWSNGSRTPSESPPASPQKPWRSFSLMDLQHCAVSASGNGNGNGNGNGVFNLPPLMGKRNKPDEVS